MCTPVVTYQDELWIYYLQLLQYIILVFLNLWIIDFDKSEGQVPGHIMVVY